MASRSSGLEPPSRVMPPTVGPAPTIRRERRARTAGASRRRGVLRSEPRDRPPWPSLLGAAMVRALPASAATHGSLQTASNPARPVLGGQVNRLDPSTGGVNKQSRKRQLPQGGPRMRPIKLLPALAASAILLALAAAGASARPARPPAD